MAGTASIHAAALDALARDTLDHLGIGCQLIGPSFEYLYVNEAVARHGRTTREELLGRTMSEVYPGIETTPMFETLRACLADGSSRQMDNEFTFPDGTKGVFELRFEPVPQGVAILSIEITDRRRREAEHRSLQEQLWHAQKMDAVGKLAGGISHDFNNVLAVILGVGSLVRDQLEPGSQVRGDVEEILQAAERAAALTRQLLTFSRHQVMEARLLDVGEVVRGVEKMLRRLIGEDVSLKLVIRPDLHPVLADPGHVEQVLVNLAVNARDAMARGGLLTIEVAPVTLDQSYGETHHAVEPGPYTMIAVSDSGVGMDRETQARIFEPFFTTKPAGKGTGLGLSTVYGIVQQSGGHVWVYSEPGKGSTFKVYLPRSRAAGARHEAPQTGSAVLSGTETVLLVEDDDQVRSAARRILARGGYRVLEAGSAAEALELVEQHDGELDLILTDVVMPEKSGAQLATELKARRPSLRVICMSGYTDEAVVRHGGLQPGIAFVQKPFTPEVLLARVRQVLDAPA